MEPRASDGFSDGPVLAIDFGTLQDTARAAVLQGTNIVVAGDISGSNPNFAVARVSATGTLDTSFGTSGKLVVDVLQSSTDQLAGLSIDSLGRYVLAGTTGSDFSTVRIGQ
ncbi:MAG: hypothetical protein ACK41E_06500 [Deinococcales bacterium]